MSMSNYMVDQNKSYAESDCQTNQYLCGDNDDNKMPDDAAYPSQGNDDQKLFIKPPKILLVEDSEIIQTVNLFYLGSMGCKTDLAKDGFEAVELFRNGYDLILLDIGLPSRDGMVKSGVDVITEIRDFEAETGTKRNIIIALTAFSDIALKECVDAGCDDFYTKPLLQNQLAEVLRRWLPHLIKKAP